MVYVCENVWFNTFVYVCVLIKQDRQYVIWYINQILCYCTKI